MALLEEDAHIFIVRIWLEPREIANVEGEWRAVIEHVTEDKRRYFKSREEIVSYISEYLASLYEGHA